MVGNLSNFTKIDIIRCLLKIDAPMSRSQLSKTLDLGEGTIRSILDILQKNNFLESNTRGHFLSEKGNKIVGEIKNTIEVKKVILINIFPEKKKIALHIRNSDKNFKSYVLRDEAVKNGADGALILKYDKKLILFDSDFEEDFSEIEKQFKISNNDLIIIAYADSYKLAEHGVLAVAIYLEDKLKNIMQKFK